MADLSLSMSKNGGAIDVLAAGSQTVTAGTSAPGAGDIELRIADSAAFTKNDIHNAIEVFEKYLLEHSTIILK